MRSVAGHKVRAGPSFSRPNRRTKITVRERVTTRSYSWAPAVAAFGVFTAVLRRCGRRWRLRDWRLRTKLTALLMVPLVLAGVLGTLRVTDLARKARDYAALARQAGFSQQLGLVVHNLQGERSRVAAMLATGFTPERAVLLARAQSQVQRVDTAVTKLRTSDFSAEALGPISVHAHPIVDLAYQAAMIRLSRLAALRQATLGSTAAPGNATASSAVAAYSDFIAKLLDLDRKVLDGGPGPLAHHVDGIRALSVAKEQASLEHAMLLTGILSGGLSPAQQATLRTAQARFDAAADDFGQVMSPAQRQLYFDATVVGDRKRLLDAALDRAVRGAQLETVRSDWNSAASGTVETIHQGLDTLVNELRTDAQARSSQAWREAFRNGAAVAVALLLAVALLVVVVRSLLQPLRKLSDAAFDVADRRLPEAFEQVLATDGIPTPPMLDPVPVDSKEEVGQVARALDTVHVQAVRLAAEQAQLRSNLSDVFANLSGRSQRLLERQLQLIEELRGATRDPDLVNSLLQLDRLATRVRRHSENLLFLAGGAVCCAGQGPVTVCDVLDSAISEIEEYQRVTVYPPPAATVAAPVAADLVHLIAELLDNATSVSPPGDVVTLSGTFTEDESLRVEITDSGPGLPRDELQEINALLVSAPSSEVSVSTHLGLFVVRQLAARHGITVRLRQRLGKPGITATALLAPSLVTVERAPEQPPVTEWSGTLEQPPLQVSVVDEAVAADLFSPSSISPSSLGVGTSQHSHPRTAQQEWLELFGQPEPLSHHLPGGQEQVAGTTDAVGIPIPPVRVAAAGRPEEVREEIFEMVSAWFRERQSAPVNTAPSSTVPSNTVPSSTASSSVAPEWQSPFDAAWQAAQALRTRVAHEFTRSGLPKRQPRAHLVFSADGRVMPTPVPVGPARIPDAVRGRLTRYQRGLRVGRHARIGPEEQLTWADIPYRPADQ